MNFNEKLKKYSTIATRAEGDLIKTFFNAHDAVGGSASYNNDLMMNHKHCKLSFSYRSTDGFDAYFNAKVSLGEFQEWAKQYWRGGEC
jgi:hypothetical protein